MKAAIIGYGKMGRAIERILRERGHEIVAIVDEENRDSISTATLRQADVAIEFTRPSAAADNYRRLLEVGLPIVSGTTGWLDRRPEIEQLVADCGGTLLWTSNFSIGVNIFMAVNRYVARLMADFPQYRPELEEIHHIHKLDHPSGTAITLANDLIDSSDEIVGWKECEKGESAEPELLPVYHRREGEVPGTHIISWKSAVDSITLTHEAFSREGFALGAVLAAEFVAAHPEKRGMLSMKDVLPF